MGHIQHQSSLHEMDYNQFGVAPPTHNITSPPNTPMTPHVSGGGGFPGLVCSIDQHHHHTSSGSLVLHQKYVHVHVCVCVCVYVYASTSVMSECVCVCVSVCLCVYCVLEEDENVVLVSLVLQLLGQRGNCHSLSLSC